MPGLADFLCVGAGGMAGAITRMVMQQVSLPGRERFWATMEVNLIGCLLIGVLWGVLHHYDAPRWVYNLAVVGFLGGFTTFSSFALDAMTLIQGGNYAAASAYVLTSLLGGLALCGGAMWLTVRVLQ